MMAIVISGIHFLKAKNRTLILSNFNIEYTAAGGEIICQRDVIHLQSYFNSIHSTQEMDTT